MPRSADFIRDALARRQENQNDFYTQYVGHFNPGPRQQLAPATTRRTDFPALTAEDHERMRDQWRRAMQDIQTHMSWPEIRYPNPAEAFATAYDHSQTHSWLMRDDIRNTWSVATPTETAPKPVYFDEDLDPPDLIGTLDDWYISDGRYYGVLVFVDKTEDNSPANFFTYRRGADGYFRCCGKTYKLGRPRP